MKKQTIFSSHILGSAFLRSIQKMNPFFLYKNPVIFITEIGAFLSTLEIFLNRGEAHVFAIHIASWLWFTVIFANFAESIAESRNQAQAETLKASRVEMMANKIEGERVLVIPSKDLKKGDIVLVRKGEIIPGDGDIIQGEASIDESSVTGESEPVIKSAGTDQTSVMSGSRVLSDEIRVQITSEIGGSFLDKMISLIEGAKRKKTENELALTIFLSGLTLIFLVVVCSLKIFSFYYHFHISMVTLAAFLVCLIPTTIGGLLTAIGIAGVNRLMQKNVFALSRQAIESAGDIDMILIDKTGTITVGKREAQELIADQDVSEEEFAKACYIASLNDETYEGKSILEWVLKKHPDMISKLDQTSIEIIPFSAKTRMSGVDQKGIRYRKGAKDAIEKFVGKTLSLYLATEIKKIATVGGTPLVVATEQKILGAVFLKDSIKPGLAEKFAEFRSMGQKTVMITGDNLLTARTIAREVGVDDFLAEATPEHKLEYLLDKQKQNFMVAMTGDGINDAPALAHADVGLAMHTGTQAAKEAGNMIDLDSNPTKLFGIIKIGKQLLMTRGFLTTFSMANDFAKYFAILPAILTPFFPFMAYFNIMRLETPDSAILSAVIFNALIIIALVPLAFHGVRFIPQEAVVLLRKNLLKYGLGGILVPFIGIKLIDMLVVSLGLGL